MFMKKSLAHGQVPTKFSLAQLEKPLARVSGNGICQPLLGYKYRLVT
jgi:hypothetical protein